MIVEERMDKVAYYDDFGRLRGYAVKDNFMEWFYKTVKQDRRYGPYASKEEAVEALIERVG